MPLVLDSHTGYLAPGVHTHTWGEFSNFFFWNEWRKRLGRGLYRALSNLRNAGCQASIVDGSFVSAKDYPRDYDAAFDPLGVNGLLVDPVLLRHDDERKAMKAKYLGEVMPWGAVACSATGMIYRDFFQQDRSGTPKGVVYLHLNALP